MGRQFATIAFTPLIKRQQELHGSRRQYQRIEETGELGSRLGENEQTLGFADLGGNKQYISVGNLQHDDRVALFLMDYAGQQRLKILGRTRISEGDEEARTLIAKLKTSECNALPERAFLIHIEAFDWNCPQHITPRFTEEEIRGLLAMRNA